MVAARHRLAALAGGSAGLRGRPRSTPCADPADRRRRSSPRAVAGRQVGIFTDAAGAVAAVRVQCSAGRPARPTTACSGWARPGTTMTALVGQRAGGPQPLVAARGATDGRRGRRRRRSSLGRRDSRPASAVGADGALAVARSAPHGEPRPCSTSRPGERLGPLLRHRRHRGSPCPAGPVTRRRRRTRSTRSPSHGASLGVYALSPLGSRVGPGAVEPGPHRLRLVELAARRLRCAGPAAGRRTARELSGGQLELRPLRHRRGRSSWWSTSSGLANLRRRSVPERTRSPAAALALLLRGAGAAAARGHVAHRLLGRRLLLRPHDRAHPHRLLRPDPHRRRRPVAARCSTACRCGCAGGSSGAVAARAASRHRCGRSAASSSTPGPPSSRSTPSWCSGTSRPSSTPPRRTSWSTSG